ncbi:MAG: hypothetical protein WDN47_00210 [Candidatus Doudnabacteria bacterium]
MRIGIEAERANLPNPTGVEHYAVQMIKNFARLDPHNEYVLYFRTKPQDWFYQLPKNFTCKIIPFPKYWTQIRISWKCSHIRSMFCLSWPRPCRFGIRKDQ